MPVKGCIRSIGWWSALYCMALPLSPVLGAAQEADPVAPMLARFRHNKPTVRLQYRVSYRLLSLELKRLAVATIHVTEGQWTSTNGTSARWACLTDFRLDSLEKTNSAEKVWVKLHNRITCVLTMPDLEAIRYVKQSDEHFHNLFRNKDIVNWESYDLESGELQYCRRDFVEATVSTNLPSAADLARQSKETIRFLKMIFAFYAGTPPADNGPTNRFSIYTEGALVAFDVRLDPKRTPVVVLDKKIPAICLRATPDKGARGKGRMLEMWAASFEDIARVTGADDLITLARQTPQWSMVPLVTQFGLTIGSVYGVLTEIKSIPLGDPLAAPGCTPAAVLPVSPPASLPSSAAP